MDRETRRLVEEFRRSDAGPIENNLIDELVAGDLDRQEFLRRAAVFGARRRNDRDAPPLRRGGRRRLRCIHGPAKVGGTLRIGSVAYNSSLEPYGLREAGSLGLAGIPGRVPHLHEQQVRGEAVAGDELEAQRRPHGLDLPDPQGREVPQRQDPERRRRRRELQAVPQPEDLADPLGAPGEHDRAIGRGEDRAVHGAVPAQGAEQRVPVPRQPDDVPGDHPAGRDRGATRTPGYRAE